MSAPKVFISYSWTNDDHSSWVAQLATDLRNDGVDAILDQWDLNEGNDAYAFMEQMVTDSSVGKVVMICDKQYCERADGRKGGVGTEAQIISPKIYSQSNQTKFVALVTEKAIDGTPYVPTFYQGRIHIDMSDAELHVQNYEQLLRWIFDKPVRPKPSIGVRPKYLDQKKTAAAGSSIKYERAIQGIRNNTSNVNVLLDEVFEQVISDLEELRCDPVKVTHEEIWNSIEATEAVSGRLVEIFGNIARAGGTDEAWKSIARFFEKLARLQYPPDELSSYKAMLFDNFKYVQNEWFLLLVVKLLSYERFDRIDELAKTQFFVEGRHGSAGELKPFTVFSCSIESFEIRNQAMQLGRMSLKADLLVQRASKFGIRKAELIEADLVLYLREAADCLFNKGMSTRMWHPATMVYAEWAGTTEKFVRSVSKRYFDGFKAALGVKSVEQFKDLMTAIREGNVQVPNFRYMSGFTEIQSLANAEKVATMP